MVVLESPIIPLTFIHKETMSASLRNPDWNNFYLSFCYKLDKTSVLRQHFINVFNYALIRLRTPRITNVSEETYNKRV